MPEGLVASEFWVRCVLESAQPPHPISLSIGRSASPGYSGSCHPDNPHAVGICLIERECCQVADERDGMQGRGTTSTPTLPLSHLQRPSFLPPSPPLPPLQRTLEVAEHGASVVLSAPGVVSDNRADEVGTLRVCGRALSERLCGGRPKARAP